MRRWTTPLIVAGVVAVAVLAAADALRGRNETKPVPEAPTVTRPVPLTLRELLRREVITGFIVYSDEDCVLHSLILPRMIDDVVRTDANEPFRLCRFTEGGGRYLEEGQVPSPDGKLLARCRDGLVVVSELESGLQRRSFIGCPPAWRPGDGRLTYAEGNRIMEEGHVLFTAQELRDAARTHPNLAGFSGRIFVHATDLAWMDQDRLLVSLEARARFVEPQYLTVMFLGKGIVGAASRFGQPAGDWFTSPNGAFAAAEDATIVTRDGDFTDPPDNLPTGRAVTFSPDDQWLAYVTNVSIYLIGTPRNSDPGRIIRLPIAAQDLAWDAISRGIAVGPPIRR